MGQTGPIVLSAALIQIREPDGWMDGWRWAPSSTSPHPLWRCASIVTQRRCKELIGFNSLPLQCQVWLFIAPLNQAALPRLPSALAARCLSKSPFSTLWDCWYDSLRHAADFLVSFALLPQDVSVVRLGATNTSEGTDRGLIYGRSVEAAAALLKTTSETE